MSKGRGVRGGDIRRRRGRIGLRRRLGGRLVEHGGRLGGCCRRDDDLGGSRLGAGSDELGGRRADEGRDGFPDRLRHPLGHDHAALVDLAVGGRTSMGPPLVAVGMGLGNDNCRQQGRYKNAGLHGRRSREPGKDCLMTREKSQATDRAEEGTG